MRSPLDAFDRRNLLTYVSLLCGMAALVSATLGRLPWAGGAIALAVIADTFDGRFARLFAADAARTAMGGELDSLADAIVFGAVPVACSLLQGAMPPLGRVYLGLAACAYVACAITRLAFFNVQHGQSPGGFVGLPVPVAALIWSSTLLLHPSPITGATVIAASAAAMVLPLRIARPTGLGLLLFVCWPVAVAIGHLG